MDQFQHCFVKWVTDLHDTLEGVVAIDGKTLRRSFDTGSDKAAIHQELIEQINAELKRAYEKFPGRNVTFAALVEEVGKLATATNGHV